MRLVSGETLLYSGHTEDGAPHSQGAWPRGWHRGRSVRSSTGCPSIITAKFATKKTNMKLNIIQCYAPTNDAEDEKKDDFYHQLQAALDKRREKDITILLGDFNAKIGSDHTGYEGVMGTQGLGKMNENGCSNEARADGFPCDQGLSGLLSHHDGYSLSVICSIFFMSRVDNRLPTGQLYLS
ncbi:hypothetical protein NHX12_024045 [Muraenolepis orangiensis]|uniref:Endonuclease/exonuclease/phosphatase domain-containing protein n=1 Tax=Muraenolepis orangiensis TaxID=630683 RepID=A0A9Q0ELZ4_9TELE|nr:hypothetical protein NHX12_024045 [Muraenolepis orangiensis]